MRLLGDNPETRLSRLRRRLGKYFEQRLPRHVNTDVSVLVDHAIDVIVANIEKDSIDADGIERYACKVAHFVVYEEIRRQSRLQYFLSEYLGWLLNRHKKDHECAHWALERLEQRERELIEEYYPNGHFGGRLAEHRRVLAERLGMTRDALKTRAYEINRELNELYIECTEKRISQTGPRDH